jgi:hypothetical protein
MLCGMRQESTAVRLAVVAALRQQGDLITRSQALAAGMTEAALRHRIRVDGPWSVVLPGIYLAHNGPLTGGQREIAAVLYAGRGCVITGPASLQRQGVRVPLSEFVDVLIPDSAKRQSVDFVRTHRTKRMPERPWVNDRIRWAPVARAVADVARGDLEFRTVRAVVADAVQRRKCTIEQLASELRAGPNRGSGMLRAALEEVADGVASSAEGDLRKLVKGSKLPEPMYNPGLYVGDDFLAKPDLWWRDAGVAGELDSREWHLSPELWAQTMARHSAMSAQGIIVLHFTPSRVKSDAARIVAELGAAIGAGLRRPALAIRTVPHR